MGNLILSPELKLSNLLSSNDEFKASIHVDSTDPSKIIQGQMYGFSLLLSN